eukprot:jgi/Tetstr1/464013/TSEL_008818.t1
MSSAADNMFAMTNPWTGQVNRVRVRDPRKHEAMVRQIARTTGMCLFCGMLNDHIKCDCPSQKLLRSEADRKGLCRCCERSGHFERECPHRGDGSPTTSPEAYARGSPGRADRVDRW